MNSLSIGPLALSIQRFLVIFAVVIAWIVAAIAGRQRKAPAADALFSLILLSLLGARIVFVLRYWSFFLENPISIVDIRDGGFDPWGALVVGVLWLALRLYKDARVRVPLLSAVITGVAVWGIGTSMFHFMEQQGRQMPDVELSDSQGASILLADAVNKEGGTVVNLWATWCPPCQREMPVLEKAQNDYEELRFVFVNQGEAEWTVEQFLQREDLDLNHMLYDKHGKLAQQIGAHGLPATLFYSAEGELVDLHMGELSAATLARSIKRLGPAKASTTIKE